MTWVVAFEDVKFTSDDMTLEELGAYEDISGDPWSIANPIRRVANAKAFLTIAMMRAGRSDEEIAQRLQALTVGEIKNAFDYIPDGTQNDVVVEENAGDDGSVPLEQSLTSLDSLSGASEGGNGRRKKRVNNE